MSHHTDRREAMTTRQKGCHLLQAVASAVQEHSVYPGSKTLPQDLVVRHRRLKKDDGVRCRRSGARIAKLVHRKLGIDGKGGRGQTRLQLFDTRVETALAARSLQISVE